ncbi:hypothetical protein GMDG_08186, partial [Pseudogymnoascus destructans 20631-21]
VCCKSLGVAERETLIAQAVLDVQSKKYKSAYHAEKFGLLKKRLTAALSSLNQAQLACIQKYEWMEAYIQARLDICNHQMSQHTMALACFLLIPSEHCVRCSMMNHQSRLRPKPPHQYDIFDRVFINSSPPDGMTLRSANALLTTTINGGGVLSTPVQTYIQKLTVASEQLRARSIVHQLDANNLRSVIKRRKVRTKGKRVILKDHFHVSTQELCDAVMEAEKATHNPSKKKPKQRISTPPQTFKLTIILRKKQGNNLRATVDHILSLIVV